MNVENRSIDILLVEDNPGDVRLTKEALHEGKISNRLFVVNDGVQAMDYLHRRAEYQDAVTPDLILLDLNLPRKDGRQVLHEIKTDEKLKIIPVVVLTTSAAEDDVMKSYNLHANCYITKPVDLDQFLAIIRTIEDFWLTVVRLPRSYQ